MEHSALKTLARLTVPALLVLVASVHFYMGHTSPLNPWVGGGFGMFASVDKRDFRAVRASADAGGTRIALDVRGWAEASDDNALLLDRVEALPNEPALETLEGRLRGQEWNTEGEVFEGDSDETRAAPIEDIEISVYRLEYDDEDPTARPVLVAAHPDERVSQ